MQGYQDLNLESFFWREVVYQLTDTPIFELKGEGIIRCQQLLGNSRAVVFDMETFFQAWLVTARSLE